jgi:hypothetical protein
MRNAWWVVMIHWPDPSRMSRGSRANLVTFRRTSAAKALDEDTHTWQLEATSWSAGLPARFIWRNEEGCAQCIKLEEDGLWVFEPYDSTPVIPHRDDPLTPLGCCWPPTQ